MRHVMLAFKSLCCAALLVACSIVRAQPPSAAGAPTPLDSQGHVAVHGLKVYYEIHGRGEPLVLLHGGLSNIATDFGKILPVLAKTRRVIAIEQQGHGHTADGEHPLRYEQMADDTAAVLAQLKVTNADFVGYSMGGGVATQIAIRHPALVRRFVFFGGAAYNPSGYYPQMAALFAQMKPDQLIGTPWQKAYATIAPHPEAWSTLVSRVMELDQHWTGFAEKDLRAITAPALLIIGDGDIVSPEHTTKMVQLLGGGVPGDIGGPAARSQLAVLPGTTHVTISERSGWLLDMIQAFLSPARGSMP
jgi:pimeloyl-ACP methyl ester carboxylesterase